MNSSHNSQNDKLILPSIVMRQQQLANANLRSDNQSDSSQVFDRDGLVQPRRLGHHNHQQLLNQPTIIRDLNRELKFNQIRGINVLSQKSELSKALEKLGESKKRKEMELERLTRRSSLELRLEERAHRIAKEVEGAQLEACGNRRPEGDSSR